MAYLFSGGALRDYLDGQIFKMKNKIKSLDPKRVADIFKDGPDIVKNRALAQFVDGYKIEVPRLLRLPSREEINPHDVTRTRPSIDIPFVGSPDLFILRPDPMLYDFYPTNAIVKAGVITLQFGEIENKNVYEIFEDIYKEIWGHLAGIEQCIVSFHRELESVAYKGIKARYEELYKDRETPDRFTRASDEDIDQSRREFRGGLEL